MFFEVRPRSQAPLVIIHILDLNVQILLEVRAQTSLRSRLLCVALAMSDVF